VNTLFGSFLLPAPPTLGISFLKCEVNKDGGAGTEWGVQLTSQAAHPVIWQPDLGFC
jgi:hypothetical protein